MIEAKIIADSINPTGHRLTTFILTYPRFIHSELMTHRMFSRNAASSRAIPISKMIERIENQPAMPIYWGKNQKGMQASQELSEKEIALAKSYWLSAAKDAIKHAVELSTLGVHKQIANRILEPFAHMTTLLTATEFANYFNLRCHPDPQPEFQNLARLMCDLYYTQTPTKISPGYWHIPFGDRYLAEGLSIEQRLKICTARAARVSYMNFDGNFDHEKDYQLHDDLLANGHMSCFEHCAQSTNWNEWSGNFHGWLQYRKTINNENRGVYNYAKYSMA